MIYSDKDYLPNPEAEKARYCLHQNKITDIGYHSFLMQIINPLLLFLNNEMIGLDFGCGPSPSASLILNAKGYECENYDPFFFPELPERQFNYIVAIECFEHFHHPVQDISKILQRLKPGGFLAIKTETWLSESSISNWHYIRDFTHVSFYHNNTLNYIAKNNGFSPVYTDKLSVFIFKKDI